MSTMTRFEKQLQIEKQKRIAKKHCKICKDLIGNKPYLVFEERYFHSFCLKNEESYVAPQNLLITEV